MAMREDEEMDRGEMTVSEAGHKGGEETARTHGHEFYEEIGEKGGEETARTHGHDFYEEIGQKGGQKVRELIRKGEESEMREGK